MIIWLDYAPLSRRDFVAHLSETARQGSRTMSLRRLNLALAAAGVVISAAPAPAEAAHYDHHSPPGHAALKRAYAECNARLSHLPKYRGWPQRYLAVEGCVQDMMRR
jgi:hypothetical protein